MNFFYISKFQLNIGQHKMKKMIKKLINRFGYNISRINKNLKAWTWMNFYQKNK